MGDFAFANLILVMSLNRHLCVRKYFLRIARKLLNRSIVIFFDFKPRDLAINRARTEEIGSKPCAKPVETLVAWPERAPLLTRLTVLVF